MGRIEHRIRIFLIREDVAVFASSYAGPSHDGVFRYDSSRAVVADHSAEHPVVGGGYVVVFVDRQGGQG